MKDFDRRAEGTWLDSLDPILARRFEQRLHPGVIPLDVPRRVFGWLEYLEARLSLAKEIALRRGFNSGTFAQTKPIVYARRKNDDSAPASSPNPPIAPSREAPRPTAVSAALAVGDPPMARSADLPHVEAIRPEFSDRGQKDPAFEQNSHEALGAETSAGIPTITRVDMQQVVLSNSAMTQAQAQLTPPAPLSSSASLRGEGGALQEALRNNAELEKGLGGEAQEPRSLSSTPKDEARSVKHAITSNTITSNMIALSATMSATMPVPSVTPSVTPVDERTTAHLLHTETTRPEVSDPRQTRPAFEQGSHEALRVEGATEMPTVARADGQLVVLPNSATTLTAETPVVQARRVSDKVRSVKHAITSNTNTSNINTSNTNTSNTNTSNINTSNTNTSNTNTSNINTSNINTSNINTSNINTSNINTSNINTSNINTSNINTSNINASNTIASNTIASSANASNIITSNVNTSNIITSNVNTSTTNTSNTMALSATMPVQLVAPSPTLVDEQTRTNLTVTTVHAERITETRQNTRAEATELRAGVLTESNLPSSVIAASSRVDPAALSAAPVLQEQRPRVRMSFDTPADEQDTSGRYVMPAMRRRPRSVTSEPSVTPNPEGLTGAPFVMHSARPPINAELAVEARPTAEFVVAAHVPQRSTGGNRQTVDAATASVARVGFTRTHVVRGVRSTTTDSTLPRVTPRANPRSDAATDAPFARRHTREVFRGTPSDGPTQRSRMEAPRPPVVTPNDTPLPRVAAPALPHPGFGRQTQSASGIEQAALGAPPDARVVHARAQADEPVTRLAGASHDERQPSASAPVDIEMLTDKIQRKIIRRLAAEAERKGSFR